ncbi:DNA polymerase III subunit delta' C-terminal domain-containing protein [Natribacillus halophilus]|uniref:DNA polymerase III subunit delta' n=1 Tax=Natribacillus halophilus TaxID=549003 RepID=A0A1G8SVK5_9BACI|nr:DNA polymerase III subunit delta' C-terminal domain-containing protein [Natribacillus halophilus]SDJ33278.1 DNA polymerase-3 subunit delta' [Natribacillus halophilus]
MEWGTLRAEQPVVTQLLQHAVWRERLPHAYIFEGEDRDEQLGAAFLLARAFLCSNNDPAAKPCNQCSECKRVQSGQHPDIIIIRSDGLSIKKAQVEFLQKEFAYKGMESTRKAYIIEEADKMTTSAANSLLASLEEPEGEALAILETENLHFLLPTIVSRSQVISFRPLSEASRQAHLREKGETEEVAAIKARVGNKPTSLEDGERTNWIVQGRQVVIQLAEEVFQRPLQAKWLLQDKWHTHFNDREGLDTGLDFLLFWYRDVLYTKWGREDLAYPDQLERLKTEALNRSESMLAAQMKAVMEAKRYLAANVNPQLLMERLLLRLQEGSNFASSDWHSL